MNLAAIQPNFFNKIRPKRTTSNTTGWQLSAKSRRPGDLSDNQHLMALMAQDKKVRAGRLTSVLARANIHPTRKFSDC
jgi:hypothetical protein